MATSENVKEAVRPPAAQTSTENVVQHVVWVRETPTGRIRQEQDFFFVSVAQARAEVAAKGGTVISIKTRRHWVPFWQRTARTEKTYLLQSIGFLLADASPSQALKRLIQAEDDPKRQRMLAPAQQMLKQGRPFVHCLRALGMFDRSTMAIIAAGETSGSGGLSSAIHQAIEQVNNQGRERGRILKALSILWVEILSSVSAAWGIQFTLLPYLEKSGTAVTADSKVAFESAIALAYRVNEGLLALSLGVTGFAAWLMVMHLLNREADDHVAARIVRKIPVLGQFLRDAAVADTFAILSRMLRANMPFTKAAEIVGRTAAMPELRHYFQRVCDTLRFGVNQAMGVFPVTRAETLLISSHRNINEHLPTILDLIVERRRLAAEGGMRRVLTMGGALMILFSFAVALNALYIFWSQSEAIMSGMKMGIGDM